MNDNDITKAFDILDKFDFFGGQRAGRELWFGKPVDVQNKDIADFVRDVAFLKDFITQQKAENESLGESVRLQAEMLYDARAEAIREFAEKLKEMLEWTTEPLDEYDIDSLVKEMTEEHNAEENSI